MDDHMGICYESRAEKALFEEVAGVSSTVARTNVAGPHSMSNARKNIKHSDTISRPFDDECGISRASLGRPPGRYQGSHVRGSGNPPCCREHHCRGEPPSRFSPPGTPTTVATGVQVAAVQPPPASLVTPVAAAGTTRDAVVLVSVFRYHFPCILGRRGFTSAGWGSRHDSEPLPNFGVGSCDGGRAATRQDRGKNLDKSERQDSSESREGNEVLYPYHKHQLRRALR